MRRPILNTFGLAAGALLGAVAGSAAWAEPAGPATDAAKGGAPAAASFGPWLDAVTFSGRIEAGATANAAAPANGINFGQLTTDKSNQLILNQFALAFERAPSLTTSAVDFGFRVSGMYGADSRYTHFLGLGDQGTTNRNAFDLVEANLAAHVAAIAPGGVDVRAGLMVSPMGYERLDPTQDFFYSKSYIYDFGLPRKHVGVLTTTHVNPLLDLYLGYDTGVNTSVGPGGGYNDASPHVLGGFGLDLPGLNIQALAHVGPEDRPDQLPAGVGPHGQLRYIGDVVARWRIGERLTSITEFNYIRDDGLRAHAGGVAEYLTYVVGPRLSVGARVEAWRDAQGAFVAGYPANLDYLDVEEGLPNHAYRVGAATYGALTLGLNYRPGRLAPGFSGPADSPFGPLTIRPEIRYDRALAGRAPFGSGSGASKDQVTLGVDVVVPLTFQRPSAGEARETALPVSEAEVGAPMAATRSAAADPGPITPHRQGEAFVDRAAATWTLGAGQLSAMNAAGVADLAALDTRLTIAPSASDTGGLTTALRGLADAHLDRGQTPGVDVVIDGVRLDAGAAQLFDPWDAAQVSVVAGPAGVARGDGAVAGAVLIERPRPTRAWGLDLAYSLEQGFHANTEKALFNAPVGRSAGLSLYVDHEKRGGHLTNIATGDGLYGGDDVTKANLQFDWTVSPAFEVNLAVTLAHEDGQGAPWSLGDSLAAALGGAALTAKQPGLTFNAYGSPYLPGRTTPLGPWQSANDFPDRSRLTEQVYALTMAYDAGWARLNSTTAYVHEDDRAAQDLDGGCALTDLGGVPCQVLANPLAGYLHATRAQASRRFAQDLTATHEFAGAATLTGGFSYAHDEESASQAVASGQAAPQPGAPTSLQSYRQTRRSVSGFASLVVNLTDRLSLTGGLRYIDDQTSFQQAVALSTTPSAPLAASAGARDDKRLLSDISIAYRLDEASRLYASRSSGFRPGGLSFQSALSEQSPGQANYDPARPSASYGAFNAETDDSYEVGATSEVFNRQLRASVDGFWTLDHNRQVSQTVLTPGYAPGFETYIVNLPRVDIKGVEARLDYRPAQIPGLDVFGEGAYQHARIADGRVPAAEAAVNGSALAGSGASGAQFDLTGAPLERSPTLTFALRADYTRPLGPGLADFNVGYRWTGRQALAITAGQGDYQPAYGLLDVSLSYRRSFYRIMVTARNILNHVYLTDAASSLFIHQWGEPRTVSVGLEARF